MRTFKNNTNKIVKVKYCIAIGHGSVAHVHQWRHVDVPIGCRLTFDDTQSNAADIIMECQSQQMVEVPP